MLHRDRIAEHREYRVRIIGMQSAQRQAFGFENQIGDRHLVFSI
jgi:hypothetical protein